MWLCCNLMFCYIHVLIIHIIKTLVSQFQHARSWWCYCPFLIIIKTFLLSKCIYWRHRSKAASKIIKKLCFCLWQWNSYLEKIGSSTLSSVWKQGSKFRPFPNIVVEGVLEVRLYSRWCGRRLEYGQGDQWTKGDHL